MTKKLAHVLAVVLLAALAACSGSSPIGPSGPTCNDPAASNFGGQGSCTYPTNTTVTLDGWMYHRTAVNNPNRVASDPPDNWVIDGTAVCGGVAWWLSTPQNWDAATQNWSCGTPVTLSVGTVHQMVIGDLVRATGVRGSETVCSVVSQNDRIFKSVKGDLTVNELCYFKVDSKGNLTSTDANGNPI